MPRGTIEQRVPPPIVDRLGMMMGGGKEEVIWQNLSGLHTGLLLAQEHPVPRVVARLHPNLFQRPVSLFSLPAEGKHMGQRYTQTLIPTPLEMSRRYPLVLMERQNGDIHIMSDATDREPLYVASVALDSIEQSEPTYEKLDGFRDSTLPTGYAYILRIGQNRQPLAALIFHESLLFDVLAVVNPHALNSFDKNT